MLKKLALKNFTLFQDATIQWSSGLNIIVGENSTGKSQLLKIAYSLSWVSSHQKKASRQTKDELQRKIADKLVTTCRPEYLGRLVSRKQGRNRCDVSVSFVAPAKSGIRFSFASNSRAEVKIINMPETYIEAPPIFIPTREMLSIFPGFISVYEEQHLEFEETYYDLAKALSANARKRHSSKVQTLITSLERLMNGHIKLENGRFYLFTTQAGKGKIEIHLIAEGVRKIAMLAHLLMNGSLRDRGTLFWDEPETNLNPRLMVSMAKALMKLAQQGYQIVLATHSLFILREIAIIQARQRAPVPVQYIGLGLDAEDDSVKVVQSDSIDQIEPFVMLDEDLAQSNRYLEAMK